MEDHLQPPVPSDPARRLSVRLRPESCVELPVVGDQRVATIPNRLSGDDDRPDDPWCCHAESLTAPHGIQRGRHRNRTRPLSRRSRFRDGLLHQSALPSIVRRERESNPRPLSRQPLSRRRPQPTGFSPGVLFTVSYRLTSSPPSRTGLPAGELLNIAEAEGFEPPCPERDQLLSRECR